MMKKSGYNLTFPSSDLKLEELQWEEHEKMSLDRLIFSHSILTETSLKSAFWYDEVSYGRQKQAKLHTKCI